MKKKELGWAHWRILILLSSLSVVSYVHRVNISIAATFMKRDLSLSDIQLGQIFSSFMVGYALFQIPAGIVGDRWGPRLVFTVAACWWGVATLLTGMVPGVWVTSGLGIFVSILTVRFLLGVGEAATYPVAARAVADWIPISQRAFGNSIVLAGIPVGTAVAPPLIAWLMVTFGWRESFYITSAGAVLMAIVWRMCTSEYPSVRWPQDSSSRRKSRDGAEDSPVPTAPWWMVFRDRTVCLLTVSYFFEGYVFYMFVFWFYLYLVDVRGFSVLRGSMFASLPWLVAIVTTPMGGKFSDVLTIRFGRIDGARLIVMGAYGLAALLLLLGARAQNAYLAVAALSLSAGVLMSAEAAFWSSAIDVGGSNVGAVSGAMNTAGNVGGVVSTALVPVLVQHFGWPLALGTGSAAAVLCALTWLGIRARSN